jgi:hypothetical protein
MAYIEKTTHALGRITYHAHVRLHESSAISESFPTRRAEKEWSSKMEEAQYEKAIDDFDTPSYHIGYSQNIKEAKVVAFRAAFGKVISCDKLGLHDHAEQAIQQLQKLAERASCDDCLEHVSHENLSLENTEGNLHKLKWDNNKKNKILPNDRNLPLYDN